MKTVYCLLSICLLFLSGCDLSHPNHEISSDYSEELEYESNGEDIPLDDVEIEFSETESVSNSFIPALSDTVPAYNSTYHTDNSFQYEYRTGVSGNYNYNYDVSGTDDYGEDVSGNLDMQGKYGSGYIVNEAGDEVEVEAEWMDYGVIEATDYYGNTYELTTD